MVAGVTTDAGTKMKAIMAEQAQMTNYGIGGDASAGENGTLGDEDDPYSLTIKRPHSGTEIEIADTANAGDDDPKFVDQMADLGMHGDFAGSMHVRKMEADDDGNVESEVVMVRTDIDAPTATPFDMVAGQDLDTNPKTTDGTDFQSLDIAENGTAENDVEFAKVGGPAAAASGGTQTITYEDDTATQDVNERRFTGTYNGADGTYVCSVDPCTAMTNDKGVVTGMGGTWTFTPEKDATSDVVDANYLAYGFWLKRTLDSDGRTTYNEVETYAMAVGHLPTGDGLGGVMGTATYEGGSAGVYVKNTLDNQGNITTSTSGHFTADVELNASFGGGNVPANEQFSIDGTVDKFVLNGQFGQDANDWAVKLGLADFSGTEDRARSMDGSSFTVGPGTDARTGNFNGAATGDSTAAAGTWNGTFYGDSSAFDHDMDGATPGINREPVAVIGEFNANFTDGTAAGGFGANKE